MSKRSLDLLTKRKLPALKHNERKTISLALSYGIAWCESLIDAHNVTDWKGELSNPEAKELIAEWNKEIKHFEELQRELNFQGALR